MTTKETAHRVAMVLWEMPMFATRPYRDAFDTALNAIAALEVLADEKQGRGIVSALNPRERTIRHYERLQREAQNW